MIKWPSYLLLLLLSMANHAVEIPVLVADDVLQFYKRVKAKYNIDTLTDYSTLPQGRDLVDLLILERALKLGGCDCTLSFNNSGIYERNLQLVLTNQFVMMVDTVWQTDLAKYPEQLLITAPVIKYGQYDVGLYTSPNNTKALNTTHIEQLRQLTAVSNQGWSADWQTLQQLKPNKLAHVDSWYTLVKVVNKQLADFTLLHFRNSPSHQLQLEKLNLTPIPNIKAILWDSRHFALAKNHPLSAQVYEALNKGLTQLEQQGIIRKAYQDIGINSPATRDWQILNPLSPTEFAYSEPPRFTQ